MRTQQQFFSLPPAILAGFDLQQPPATEREDVVTTNNEDCAAVFPPSPPLLPEEDNELVEFQTDGMSMKLDIGQENAASLFKVHITWEQVESSSPVQSDPI